MQKSVAEFREHELVRAFERHLVIRLAVVYESADVAALDFGKCLHVALDAPQVAFGEFQVPHDVCHVVAVVVVRHHVHENPHHTFTASHFCHKYSIFFSIYKKSATIIVARLYYISSHVHFHKIHPERGALFRGHFAHCEGARDVVDGQALQKLRASGILRRQD